MVIIHDHIHPPASDAKQVFLRVDRLTLAKRRWRGAAEDGREFGFDLHHPLEHGDVFFTENSSVYVIGQNTEPVLEIALASAPPEAARLGWLIGNLHFGLEIVDSAIRVADDPALRQLFDREHIPFHAAEAVFSPVSGGHSHAH